MGKVKMETTRDGKKVFIWQGTYEERHIPKNAGFRWDPNRKVWYTFDTDRVALLSDYADAAVQEYLKSFNAQENRNVLLSVPEGLHLFPYQEEGAKFLLRRTSALLADDMGLGKTAQVLVAINSDPEIHSVLVICPASVKLNWVREAKRWLTREFRVAYLSGRTPEPLDLSGNVLYVINYDIAAAWSKELSRHLWDVIVLDESHYLKNTKAQRTKAILGSKIGQEFPLRSKRRIALSGTPIVNRPVEAWPVLAWLDPERWGNFWAYAKRYCGAYHNGWGWDFSGASNLEELNARLRKTIMLRRTKNEVLKDLPSKIRQVLELPANGASSIIRREREEWERWQDEIAKAKAAVELAKAESEEALAQAFANLQRVVRVAFNEMSKVRHEVALAKAPVAVEHIRDVLESKEKVVVWVHHRDVAEILVDGLKDYNPVVVLGGVSAEERAEAVRRFQEDSSVRVFVGGITAAAEGITLTAADTAIFVELDWRPGKLLQAEDRIHRIGQTRGVLVQYLVFEGSLDATMAQKLARKMEVIAKAVDGGWSKGDKNEEAFLVPEEEEEVRAPSPKEEVPAYSQAVKEFVLQALRYLASWDQDRARSKNDVGFSRYDSYIGHKLAEQSWLSDRQTALGLKLVRKYRRQLSHMLHEAPSEVREFVGF